ncbi:MAG: alpha/beta hydrolase-fold protein [Candidatus Latescibacteria bacterium]|nr:alpha/beta hydrolase-fold protein [Candidatus Latescibacterota bacterium]
MRTKALTLPWLAAAAFAAAALATAAPAAGAGRPLDRLLALERLPMSERQAAVTVLLVDHPFNPIIAGGDTLLLFYRGPGHDVRLAGDQTAWLPTMPLAHLPGTDLWSCVLVLPPQARVDYKFVVDSLWLLDARNPRTCTGGFGPNSEVRGIDYREPEFVSAPATALCRTDRYELPAPALGGPREVLVLTPPGEPRGRRPCLLVHDGLEYVTLGGLDRALAWLAEHRPELDLPICVCVPPGRRTEEYAGGLQEPFGLWVTGTLQPFIAVQHDVGMTWGVLGASYGGNSALDLARRYPGRFDRVAAMSPYVAPELKIAYAAMPPQSVRVYLNWGAFDLPQLIPMDREFAALLVDCGFACLSEEKPQGHSWGFWRDSVPSALSFLYSGTHR